MSGDGFTVTGGAGGALATAEWLEAAARLVALAATEAEGALNRVRLLDRLVDEAAEDSPGTASAASYALDPMLRHRLALRWRLRDLGDLGDRLRGAARAHRAAEQAARTEMDRAVRTSAALGAGLGELGPLAAWQAFQAVGHGLSAVLLLRGLRAGSPTGRALIGAGRLTADVPGPAGWGLRVLTGRGLVPEGAGLVPARDLRRHVMPFLGAWITTIRPGRQGVPDEPLAAGASAVAVVNRWAGAAVGRDRDGVLVRQSGSEPAVAPVDAAGCLELLALDQPAHGAGPGQVSVRRIEFDDGATTWLVTVPGTQEWGLGTAANPLDLASNLELVGRGHPDAVRAVTEAMEQAGIAAPDDVVLAGHSQGGMVAADVAVGLAVAGHGGRIMAVTAGSPVGAVLPPRLPGGVDVVAYTHTHDPVTGLQAGENPADPHLVTVERDLSATGGSNRGVADQHGLDGYIATAEGATALGDPSVDAAEARLARLLGSDREVVSVTREVFVARRAAPAPGAGTGGPW